MPELRSLDISAPFKSIIREKMVAALLPPLSPLCGVVLNSLVVLCSPTLFRDEKKWKVAIPFYVESWERQSVQRKERETENRRIECQRSLRSVAHPSAEEHLF